MFHKQSFTQKTEEQFLFVGPIGILLGDKRVRKGMEKGN